MSSYDEVNNEVNLLFFELTEDEQVEIISELLLNKLEVLNKVLLRILGSDVMEYLNKYKK